MKMAKASEADINMAMTVANMLDDIECGYFPEKLASDPESEDSEWLETACCEQYERLIDGLKRVLNQGSVFRVIWGMAVVCDPSNELLDPTSDVLAVHPKLTLALEQRDDAVKTAAAVNAQFEAISKQQDELLAIIELILPEFRQHSLRMLRDGRLYCGPRVLVVRDGLRRVRWAKKGYRHGNRIAARMKLWRVTGEPPF